MAGKRLRLPTRENLPRPSGMRASGHQRRLSDKMRVAFHAACDEGAVDIAERLLSQLDQLINRPPLLPTGIDRRRPEHLIAPAERLANLLLWSTPTGGTNPQA